MKGTIKTDLEQSGGLPSGRLSISVVITALLLSAAGQQVRADFWDFSEGTVITNWSATKSDIRNMFGGNYGPDFSGPEGTHMLFADNYPAGTVHFVEWRTPAPITLRSFSLQANHDGLPADALLRGFSSFRLFAEDPDTGHLDNMLYEISLTNPYGDTPEPLFRTGAETSVVESE